MPVYASLKCGSALALRGAQLTKDKPGSATRRRCLMLYGANGIFAMSYLF